MRINNGNSVQGIYNADTAPIDCIFTYGDIVVKDSTMYICKGDTTTRPILTNPNWEIYMGRSWSYLNSLQDIEYAPTDKIGYIGPEGLSQFMKSKLGGLNSNGRLQLLDDPTLVELNSLTTNSHFQLSYNYLISTAEVIPFIPDENKVYTVRTTGALDGESNLVIQEIIELPKEGTYRSWVRHGQDISLSTWTPTRSESFNEGFFPALNNIVESYIRAKAAYDGLVNNIHEGNYYSYELLQTGAPRNYIRFIQGTESLNGSEIVLDPDFHYKIFLREDMGQGNFISSSIDVTPEDLVNTFNPGDKVTYFPVTVSLEKDPEGSPDDGWTLQGGGTHVITRILKSKQLIS